MPQEKLTPFTGLQTLFSSVICSHPCLCLSDPWSSGVDTCPSTPVPTFVPSSGPCAALGSTLSAGVNSLGLGHVRCPVPRHQHAIPSLSPGTGPLALKSPFLWEGPPQCQPSTCPARSMSTCCVPGSGLSSCIIDLIPTQACEAGETTIHSTDEKMEAQKDTCALGRASATKCQSLKGERRSV